jgi:hypothetical protein
MSNLEQAERAETELDVPRLIESALNAAKRESIASDFTFQPIGGNTYEQSQAARSN